jgi:hypothetical protein
VTGDGWVGPKPAWLGPLAASLELGRDTTGGHSSGPGWIRLSAGRGLRNWLRSLAVGNYSYFGLSVSCYFYLETINYFFFLVNY